MPRESNLNTLLRDKLYKLSSKEEKIYFNLQEIGSDEIKSDFASESLRIMQEILDGITADDLGTLEEKLSRIRTLLTYVQQAEISKEEKTILLNTAKNIEKAIKKDLSNKKSILKSASSMMDNLSDRVQGAAAMMFANDPMINLITKGTTAGASFVAKKIQERVQKSKEQKSALKRDVASLINKNVKTPRPSDIPGVGPMPDVPPDVPSGSPQGDGPLDATAKLVDILGVIAVDVKTILSLMMEDQDRREDENFDKIEQDRERLRREPQPNTPLKNDPTKSSKFGGFLGNIAQEILKYFGIAAGASALTAALTAVAWPAVFAAAGLGAAYMFLKSEGAKNFFDKTSGAITGGEVKTVDGLGVLPAGPKDRSAVESALSSIMPYLPESELLGNVGLKEGIKASNDIYDLQRTLKLRKKLLEDVAKSQKDSDRLMDGSTFSGMGKGSLGVPLWMKKLQIDAMENIALPLQQEKYRREIETFSGKREWSDLTNEESIKNALFVAKEHKKNLEVVLSKLKDQTDREDELFKKSGLPYWAFAQQNPGFEEARLEREKMEKEIKYIDSMVQGLEDPKKSLESLNGIIESLNKELEKFEEKFKLGDVVPTLPQLETKAFRTPLPQVSPGELSNLDGIISEASRQYNVPKSLIKAMIRQESGGNPNAVSKAGAGGLMQLMPGTAKQLGVTNRFDPGQNIMGGTKYIRQMLDMYGGNTQLALAAYNAGPYNKAVMRGVIPKNGETPGYVRRVMAFEQQFRAIPSMKAETFNTKVNEQAQSANGAAQISVFNTSNNTNVGGEQKQTPLQSGNGGPPQPDSRGLSTLVANH